MSYSLHQLLQRRKAALQPRFLGAHPNLEVSFSVSRAIERQAQKVDSFRAVPAAFVRVFLREPTKLDQFGRKSAPTYWPTISWRSPGRGGIRSCCASNSAS